MKTGKFKRAKRGFSLFNERQGRNFVPWLLKKKKKSHHFKSAKWHIESSTLSFPRSSSRPIPPWPLSSAFSDDKLRRGAPVHGSNFPHLSLTSAELLSLLLSFSLAKTVPLSLRPSHGTHKSTVLQPIARHTHRWRWTRRSRSGEGQPHSLWMAPLAVVKAHGQAAAYHHRTTASGHCWRQLLAWTSSIRSHDRNGTLGSWRKWSDFKTRVSRQTVKTLTVDLNQRSLIFR